jgi:hypothetical protein
LPNVHNFNIDRVQYLPGDILDIPEGLYSAGFMLKLDEEPKPEAKPITEQIKEAVTEKLPTATYYPQTPDAPKDAPKLEDTVKSEEAKPKPRRTPL